MLATALFALLIRLPGIGQEPNVDELLNVLAARAWAERGEMTIVEGADRYERGAAVMRIQARAIEWSDDDLVAARWVSLGFGLLVVAGAAAWAGVAGGAVAAFVAGGLVAIDPELVQLHQSARFYAAVQAFFLLGAAMAAATLAPARPARRIAFAVVGALALWMAVGLHVIALIGTGFLVAFVILWHLPAGIAWFRRQPGRRQALVAGVSILVVVAGAAFVVRSGLLEEAIERATFVDAWAEADADNPRFYYVFLHDQFATLVVLLPLLALLAVWRNRLHGGLTFFVFLGGVAVASLLAWKAPRYISYLLPLLHVGVGLAAAAAWALLRTHVPRLTREAFGTEARWVPPLMLLAILGALALGNRALLLTGRLVTRDPAYHYPLMPENSPTKAWRLALPTLRPWLDRAAVVVSDRPPKALYFLGRLDISLQYNAIARLAPDEAREGTTEDERFARLLTRDPDVLRAAACEGGVLVVNERATQEGADRRSPALSLFLESEGERIELDPRYGLNAYWLPARTDCAPPGAAPP